MSEIADQPGKMVGLSDQNVAVLREKFGRNELTSQPRFSGVLELSRLIFTPLNLILIIASLISAFLGQMIEASLVMAMVIIGAIINFVQTTKSAHAVEALRKTVAPTATVIRNGRVTEIARSELVPGDLIQLCAGDMVPADGKLCSARDLHIQEAALTGESLPVEKFVDASPNPPTSSKVFLGSSVVSGTGRAIITETGSQTAFGHIAIGISRPAPETDFDRGTRKFGFFIAETVFVLVVLVFAVNAMMHRDLLQSLLFAVALAVGLTPEFLPVITAVTLSKGALKLAKMDVIVKHLSAMQNFGSIDILCSDKTGTITSGDMGVREAIDPYGGTSDTVFQLAYLNSSFEAGIRSPLDQAILKSKTLNIDGYQKLDEVPFDFERRCLSVIVKTPDGRQLLITKGAPESVVKLCTNIEENSGTKPLDETIRPKIDETFHSQSADGMRVLAVASREIPSGSSLLSKADERDLTFNGFVTFNDPPLDDVSEAIQALKRDQVQIKILTGDNELVAKHVCRQVGLSTERIVLGSEIDQITDAALAHIAESATIFARVSPTHKNRIILALKSRGHVVGFMGDGINDAPSLHTADVGISVSTAVDVAREAADIILLKRDLKVLHEGILEGRKAFGNVMKYLLMGTSSNFGNMFSMAIASVFLPFLPLLPVQILLNNFLYDMAQITIPTDRVDSTFIWKPRHWDISLIRRFMIYIGPLSSIYDFLTFYALLKIFKAGEPLFHTGWFVESLATQALVIFLIRTAGNPFRSRPSRPLMLTVGAVVLLGVILPYTPVAETLGFVPLPWSFFPFLFVVVGTYLLLVEVVKRKLMSGIMRPEV